MEPFDILRSSLLTLLDRIPWWCALPIWPLYKAISTYSNSYLNTLATLSATKNFQDKHTQKQEIKEEWRKSRPSGKYVLIQFLVNIFLTFLIAGFGIFVALKFPVHEIKFSNNAIMEATPNGDITIRFNNEPAQTFNEEEYGLVIE